MSYAHNSGPYFIASDYITSGVTGDLYTTAWIDREGYFMNSGTYDWYQKAWVSGSGYQHIAHNKWAAGFGSGAIVGDINTSIENNTYFGIMADKDNVWAFVSGAKVPFELWGSGGGDVVIGDGTPKYFAIWSGAVNQIGNSVMYQEAVTGHIYILFSLNFSTTFLNKIVLE